MHVGCLQGIVSKVLWENRTRYSFQRASSQNELATNEIGVLDAASSMPVNYAERARWLCTLPFTYHNVRALDTPYSGNHRSSPGLLQSDLGLWQQCRGVGICTRLDNRDQCRVASQTGVACQGRNHVCIKESDDGVLVGGLQLSNGSSQFGIIVSAKVYISNSSQQQQTLRYCLRAMHQIRHHRDSSHFEGTHEATYSCNHAPFCGGQRHPRRRFRRHYRRWHH
jgi:hypothetical protein